MKIGLILAAEGGRCDLPPLGLGFVAASINRSLPDFEVVFREKLEDFLPDRPDLIGISASTDTYSIAIKWAQRIKAQLGIPVILGGIHISLVPESLADCFDLAVIGEGENTIVEVLRSYQEHNHTFDLDALQSVAGLAFFHDGRLCRTPARPQIADLDQLARPRRELLPYYQKGGQSHIFSARGCPYHCHFCASTRMFARYRSHSIQTIIEDVEHLIQVEHAQFITFFDDLFIADKRKLDAIATQLETRGLLGKCRFMGHVRANLIDQEVCRQLKRLRMDVVSMGLESFSDTVLRSLNKTGNSGAVNQRALDLLAQHGIAVLSLFMFGTPAETAADVHYTLEQIYHNVEAGKIVDAQWGTLLPYPGTQVWDQAKARGIVDEAMDWSRFSANRPSLYLGTHLAHAELLEIINEWRAKFTLLRPDRLPDTRTNLFFNDAKELAATVQAVVRRRQGDLGSRPGDSLIRDAYDMATTPPDGRQSGSPRAVPRDLPFPRTPACVPPEFSAYETRVARWLRRNRTRISRLAIFGGSWFGARLVGWARTVGLEPVAVLDNNPGFSGRTLLDLPVHRPESGLEGIDFIVIASLGHSHEIATQVQELTGNRLIRVIAAHQRRLGSKPIPMLAGTAA